MKKLTLIIMAIAVNLMFANNGPKLEDHEVEFYKAFRANFEKKRMEREQAFLVDFDKVLLPETISLIKTLEKSDWYNVREKDWHPVFFEKDIKLLGWNEKRIVFVLHKFVNKQITIRYYYNPKDAPKEESRPDDGYRASSPEIIRITDQLWWYYYSG